MEFKFRVIDKQDSKYRPPPSSASYFSEQAFRAGYSVLDFGRAAEFFRNPSILREDIQREIEKEKIREEIIAAEIMRQRLLLEAEVEREMEALHRPERFSLFSGSAAASAMSFGPRLSLLNRCESRSVEDRLCYRNRCETGGLEMVPFHRVAEPMISEIKPSLEDILEENLYGAKRKAVTLLPAGASELHYVGLTKKPKEKWSCAICQVSASSEQSLNEHFQGKKHKAKEALGQSPLRTGKNYAIGAFPIGNRPAY